MSVGAMVVIGVAVVLGVGWGVIDSGVGSKDRSYAAVSKAARQSGVSRKSLRCTARDWDTQVYEISTTDDQPRTWRVDLKNKTVVEN